MDNFLESIFGVYFMDSALVTQVIRVSIHFSKPQIKLIVVFYGGKMSYLHNIIIYRFKKIKRFHNIFYIY